MTRAQLKQMDVFTFAGRVELKLNRQAGAFLQRRGIVNVAMLLDTNTIYEKDTVWRSLSGLREKLRQAGFERDKREHKFLITTI